MVTNIQLDQTLLSYLTVCPLDSANNKPHNKKIYHLSKQLIFVPRTLNQHEYYVEKRQTPRTSQVIPSDPITSSANKANHVRQSHHERVAVPLLWPNSPRRGHGGEKVQEVWADGLMMERGT
jgi:hypothetical protein